MKGDFTRSTFDPRKHFVRVLMQQGRVQLDADWNEQAAILLHYIQTLAADVIGPHGGPSGEFEIREPSETGSPGGFVIQPGHYYVDGILCENEQPVHYTEQADYPDPSPDLSNDGHYLVYLDVWERHITCIQDDTICEVALGGPDTATRAKTVWQVKVWPLDASVREDAALVCDVINDDNEWNDAWKNWFQPANRGLLKAKVKPTEDTDTDPCTIPPEARYRGAENQLYRVEIHTGGTVGEATFKWSRDNGAVVFPIRDLTTDTDTATVTLEHLGHDSRFDLDVGDRVEIVDDAYVLQGQAQPLLRVTEVNRADARVILEGEIGHAYGKDPARHPLLRRWDHQGVISDTAPEGRPKQADDGALCIEKKEEEEEEEDTWLNLEDGIQVCFVPVQGEDSQPHQYRTGDYWLIPARTAIGDVLWPGPAGNPEAQPPHGVEHHYAPLAIIQVNNDGVTTVENDCRRVFEPITRPSG